VVAIVYTRISQDRTGLAAGVARQLDDCERRCAERGWTIMARHCDNDASAAGKRHRPGFDAMLTDIETGRATAVVAWSLDRLQRNRRDELRLYELCRDRGVIISLVNGAELDFSSATGRLVADNLGSLARFEIELKSDRQKAAALQAAKAGRRLGGRRPFGFRADGVTIRPKEAAAVRDGFEALLAGVNLAAIARDWNARGHTTGQGSPWSAYSVRKVLNNPRYAGLRRHNGEIIAKAQWPAVVDEELAQAVWATLADPARRNTPQRGRYLLTGLALCGVCGATVHGGGNGRTRRRNYRCAGSMGHFSRQADPVDAYVTAVILARLARPDAAELLADTGKPDLDGMRTRAAALRARLDQLATDFADGVLTASQLRTATERTRANLAAVEAEMADAGRVDILGPLVSAEDAAAVWETLSTSRRRAVIDVLATVTVHPPGRGVRTFDPDTVTITPKTT
jgi:DNA invertase Pin-like site-specific DNA recombinase